MNVVVFLLSYIVTITLVLGEDRPNIIVFLVDDWGYNDVGWNQNTDTETTFLTELATNHGLILSQYYTQMQCTPSRAAFLTGRYPMRYGLQSNNICNNCAFGLTTSERVVSSEFKAAGYQTYMVGKWHLGFCRWQYTPTYRDFDNFYGFYSGEIDYWEYNFSTSAFDVGATSTTIYNGLDLREDAKTCDDAVLGEKYSLVWQQERVLSVLDQVVNTNINTNNDNTQNPFFMYVAWQSSHTPSEAPEEYLDLYLNSNTDARRAFQAQTTMLDDVMKNVISKLHSNNLWDNTLILFMSDNGAGMQFGDNYPLRGSKKTQWEGGLRVPAFISGGYLNENRRGKTLSTTPIHVTDWYLTLASAANINIKKTNFDGINMWDAIQYNKITSNEIDREILLHINPEECLTAVCGAYRWGNYKLIWSNNDLWVTTTEEECYWARSNAITTDWDILNCGGIPSDTDLDCDCKETPCLYNINEDACEYSNIIDDYATIELFMIQRLLAYNSSQASPLDEHEYDNYTLSDPNNFDGWWTPWIKDTNTYYIDQTSNLMEWEVKMLDKQAVVNEKDTPYWDRAEKLKKLILQDNRLMKTDHFDTIESILDDIDINDINVDLVNSILLENNEYTQFNKEQSSSSGNGGTSIHYEGVLLVLLFLCVILCCVGYIAWRKHQRYIRSMNQLTDEKTPLVSVVQQKL